MTNDDEADEPASGVWLHDFTRENVIDYARASRDISKYVRVLAEEGFDSVVIPSRGAKPFLRGAAEAWHLEMKRHPDRNTRLRERIKYIGSPFLQSLVLPFSADADERTQTSRDIRRYWTNVLAAIVRRDGTDAHLIFYKALVEQIAKQKWTSALPSDLPGEKFVFVDTVVSGRAICEIIEAFADAGLDKCHFLLIADDDGNSIRPEHRRMLTELETQNRCTLVPVKRLYTEDRGPAVSGVWSTVYPQILDAVRQRYDWAKNAYGAGSFYHRVSSSQVGPVQGRGDPEYNMPVTHMYASLSVTVFVAISELDRMDGAEQDAAAVMDRNLPEFDGLVEGMRQKIRSRLDQSIDYHLYSFRDTLRKWENFSPLDKETTRVLAEPRIHRVQPNASVSVSSSHLVRVELPEDEIERFTRFADKALEAKADVFADFWFREPGANSWRTIKF